VGVRSGGRGQKIDISYVNGIQDEKRIYREKQEMNEYISEILY
jgi:hypothetical protein